MKRKDDRGENYKKAWESIPDTTGDPGFDWVGMPTIADLCACMETELDLIAEGQDGTETYTKRDITTMKNWLKKWKGVSMTKQQLDAIRLLGVYTGYRFDPWALAGNAKASCRAHIMSVLHDKNIPRRYSGVNAMIEALHAINPPQGECSASQKDNFAKWCKTVIDNATGFPPH